MTLNNQLDGLVGSEVSGLCFVRDYFELHFDGPILRVLANAVLEAPGHSFRWPESDSRSGLCSLIGSCLQHVTVADDLEMTLQFTGGIRLVIPLGEDSRIGPEAVHFLPHLNAPIQVW